MYKILLVEDEARMREVIRDFLEAKGYELHMASDGACALEMLEDIEYDLILLDIMMPRLDGFGVCKVVRETKDVPIIFLTAKVDEEDQLYAYALGADDYMTKPFSLSILSAKCESLIRRAKGKKLENKLCVGDIEVDCRLYEVTVGGRVVKLEPMTYRLLVYLMTHKNQTLTREQILIRLWGYDFDGSDRVIDTHMKKLRKALGKSAKCIHTVIKVGYRLEEEK